MAMVVGLVAFGVFLLYRWIRKRKQDRRVRDAQVVLDDESPRREIERDYISGLKPSAPRYDLDLDQPATPEPPQPRRSPATPPEPAEPSYLEETRSEGDSGGPSYLD